MTVAIDLEVGKGCDLQSVEQVWMDRLFNLGKLNVRLAVEICHFLVLQCNSFAQRARFAVKLDCNKGIFGCVVNVVQKGADGSQ